MAGAVTGVVAAGVLAVAATPAAAHVTVNPSEATQGGYTRVAFRAPTESDTASTTKLEVYFPEDVVISSVRTQPVPGWRAEIGYRTLDEPAEGGHGEEITEAVEVITWTAEDEEAAIGPNEFGEFAISMGPLPEVDEIAFRALQTYSDDTVARWIEIPAEGEEAERPAPVLRLAPSEEEDTSEAAADADPDTGSAAAETEAADDSATGAGVWLGLAGLVAGLAGLALGGAAFARVRR